MKTKEKILKKFSYWFSVAVVGIVLGFALQFAKAWTEPTSAPPAGNVAAPITTGSSSQYKNAGLAVNGVFRSYSNGIFDGNVGIGTTSPTKKLDVIGTAKANEFCLGASCITSWPSGSGGGITYEDDPQVGVLAAGGWCNSDGSRVNCTGSAPTAGITSESDPQVGTLTNGKWCTSDGLKVNCSSAAPSGGVSASTTVSGSSAAGAVWTIITTASCPSGYLLSGCSGYYSGYCNGDVNCGFLGAVPNGNGCAAYAYNDHANTSVLTAYAYCVK